MKHCTHCGVKLNSHAIDLSIYLSIDRKTNNDWEKINNSEVINSEFLCLDCFSKFSSKIEQFKKEK